MLVKAEASRKPWAWNPRRADPNRQYRNFNLDGRERRPWRRTAFRA